LIADVRAEDAMLSWDRDVPVGALTNYSCAPIDFHDNNQVAGTPFYEEDRFLIKFANYWTLEMPTGYSLLITRPFNRHDLPFVTRTGLVDADTYRDNFINFPALAWYRLQWGFAERNACRAIRTGQTRQLDRAVRRHRGRSRGPAPGLSRAVPEETGVYRRRYRAPRR